MSEVCVDDDGDVVVEGISVGDYAVGEVCAVDDGVVVILVVDAGHRLYFSHLSDERI